MGRYSVPRPRLVSCVRRADETPVIPGLALTPSRMLELASDGQPISSISMESMYDDGKRTPPNEPTLDMMRGVDRGDLWENDMDFRKKMKKLYQLKSSQDAASQTSTTE